MVRPRTLKMMGVAILFATLLTCIPAAAQTGGLTGKCTGEGGKPLVGYTVQIDRMEMKWSGHVKTNKKGEYTYIGLAFGMYKVQLLDPNGKVLHSEEKKVGMGDPTELNFDIAADMKDAEKAAEANPEYQKQVEEQKQSAGVKQLFDQGRDLYAKQQFREAAAAFEKALPLAKDRNASIIMSQLAETWTQAGNIEKDPDVRKQDYATAMDYYNKVLALAPNDATLHGSLGSLYSDMGKWDEATAEFKKAAELDPTHASNYYFNLGVILVNKNQMDDAAVVLKKTVDLDPTNSNAWYWYGMALMGKVSYKPDGSLNPVPGTIEAFQTYLKLSPTGKHAADAQASLTALTGKAELEYKATKKTH